MGIVKWMLVLMLALSEACLAAGQARLEVIGFSKDGRYMAFEDYGEADAETGSYSVIRFIDVANNRYAHSPLSRNYVDPSEKDAALGATRAGNLQAARSVMRQLGIIVGGTWDHASDVEDFTAHFQAGARPYEVSLSTWMVPVQKCTYPRDGEAALLEVKLTNLRTRQARILQRDSRYLKSRDCAYDYRISDVYFRDPFVAVFLNAERPGFEGGDRSHMVVTGRLN